MAPVTNNQIHSDILGIKELLETKIKYLEERVDNTAQQVAKIDIMLRGSNGKGITTRLTEVENIINVILWAGGIVSSIVIIDAVTRIIDIIYK